MNIRKGLSTILASAALAVGIMSMTAAPAAADANFTLTNVQLDDGTTVSGTFGFNVYGYLSGWNVTTMDGLFMGNSYNPSINASYNPGDSAVTFYRAGYDGYLQIAFTAPIGSSSVAIDWANSFECFTWSCNASDTGSNIRHFDQVNREENSPFATAVPEPGTLSLMGLGLLLVGSMAWLRRRKASDLI